MVLLPCRIWSSFVSNLAILFNHPFFQNAYKYTDPQNTLWISFTILLNLSLINKIWHKFILHLYESYVFNILKIMFWQNVFPEVELVSILYMIEIKSNCAPEILLSWGSHPSLELIRCQHPDFNWCFIGMRLWRALRGSECILHVGGV